MLAKINLSKIFCLIAAVFTSVFFLHLLTSVAFGQNALAPTKIYKDSTASNQDDMAIWIHPTDKLKSLIIGSDKANGNIYVYDLSGSTLQTISDTGGQPGNIDVRYNFPLSGQLVDIVAFNDRSGGIVRVFKVDSNSRSLVRIDNGSITTSPATPNYGFGLYYHKSSQKFYAFSTKDGGGPVVQIELKDAGGGKIGGSIVKNWTYTSQTEGIVGDDENGFVFLAEEKKPIHKVSCQTGICDPNSSLDIDGGFLNSDVEGITLYRTGDNKGYLLSSSQGASEFEIYDRLAPHAHKGVFKITGASSTDGIDVTSVGLGSTFPQGVFLVHNGGASILATPWPTIAQLFGLTVDTSWDPRGSVYSSPIPTQPTVPTSTPVPSSPFYSPTPFNSPTSYIYPTSIPGAFCTFWRGAGAEISPTPIITLPIAQNSCLTQPGQTINLNGDQISRFDTRGSPMAQNTKVDAWEAFWVALWPVQDSFNYPILLAGGPNLCFSGGVIIGSYPEQIYPDPHLTWDYMHSTSAVSLFAQDSTIDNILMVNFGDGIGIKSGADNFTVRGVYMTYMRDDCIENDWLYGGLVDDSLLDGCYSAFSARTYAGQNPPAVDGNNNVWTIQNSLIRLEAAAGVYQNRGQIPGHDGFFKWDDAGISPQLVLTNNIFRADQPANNVGLGIPEGKLADCSNNTVVWLGSGSYPDSLPSTFNGKKCFTITTDVSVWDRAVDDWVARRTSGDTTVVPTTSFSPTPTQPAPTQISAPTSTFVPPSPTPPTTPPTFTPTPPVGPTLTPVPAAGGIWISKEEVALLPISGEPGCDSLCSNAWNAIVSYADSSWGTPNLSDYAGLGHSIRIWAGALAAAKFSTMPGRQADAQRYYDKVVQGLTDVMGTETPALPSSGGGKKDGSLAIARQFPRYVVAADLLGITDWGAGYKGYKNYVDYMLKTKFTFRVGDGGHSLAEGGGKCASNGCAMAQAARTAAAAYLKDQAQLDDAWLTFRRYSGDYSSPVTINFSSAGKNWYHDNNAKLAINPKGATCAGSSYPADGVIPNDQGRSGNCPSDPNQAPAPGCQDYQYPWEGLQGAYAAAYMLYRLGYNLNGNNPFQINDSALLRAVQYQWYLQNRFGNCNWYDSSRAAWVKHLANYFYGFNPVNYNPSDGGKNMGLTQWTLRR